MRTSIYKVKIRKGALGDFATQWWTDEDYAKHEAYVNKLKKNGTYLQEEEVTVELVHNPALDNRSLSGSIKSSYLTFLDFSK